MSVSPFGYLDYFIEEVRAEMAVEQSQVREGGERKKRERERERERERGVVAL